MRDRSRRRRESPGGRLPLVLLVLALLGAGCVRRTAELGAGGDVDTCGGYRELNGFGEPRADRQPAIAAYAEGVGRVLGRIRSDEPIRRPGADPVVPPPSVKNDIELMRREVGTFTKALSDAHDAAAVRGALAAFATDDAYNEADARLGDFVVKTCPR
jgi:hypothetical protein